MPDTRFYNACRTHISMTYAGHTFL